MQSRTYTSSISDSRIVFDPHFFCSQYDRIGAWWFLHLKILVNFLGDLKTKQNEFTRFWSVFSPYFKSILTRECYTKSVTTLIFQPLYRISVPIFVFFFSSADSTPYSSFLSFFQAPRAASAPACSAWCGPASPWSSWPRTPPIWPPSSCSTSRRPASPGSTTRGWGRVVIK